MHFCTASKNTKGGKGSEACMAGSLHRLQALPSGSMHQIEGINLRDSQAL